MAGVFISHSSKDKPFVYRLAVDLINRGIPVWLDAWELEVGDSLIDRIYQGIDDSTYFIVILSPTAIESGWVNKELNAGLAKEEQLGRRFILPIKMAECQTPLKIADRVYADFSRSYQSELEKLIAALKRRGVDQIVVPPDRQIIPLTFTRGAYLNQVPFERRVRALAKSLPAGFMFAPHQFIVVPEPKYVLLRERLMARREHISEDPWYTPEFETDLEHRYEGILRKEEALLEGICLIVNEMVVAGKLPWVPFAETCHWYARIVRSSLLNELWFVQRPDLPDISDYGSEFDGNPLGSGQGAAAFYGVADVALLDIGPKDYAVGSFQYSSSSFTAWVDENLLIVKLWRANHAYSSEALLAECDRGCLARYILPQMVDQHLRGLDIPISFDLDDYLMGMH